MLKDSISKTRQALKEAQQKYSVESAAAIEQVYGDIKNLNTFINKEVDIINNDKALNDRTKSNERRKVLEQAGRKLEILREKRTKSTLIEELETKLADESGAEDESALFWKVTFRRQQPAGIGCHPQCTGRVRNASRRHPSKTARGQNSNIEAGDRS